MNPAEGVVEDMLVVMMMMTDFWQGELGENVFDYL